MRGAVAVVMLMLAGVAWAQELTAPEVIAAQRAGAPLEGILRLVRDAPAVASLTPSALAALRAAGVPEVAIAAMIARTAPPTPTPPAPDDPRLADVVRMVKAGVPERLVLEQIRRSGQRYAPTAGDLVYLTANGVPEPVIAEWLGAGAEPTPQAAATPTPRPTESAAFEPLLRMDGAFRRRSTGRAVLAGDVLHWYPAQPAGEDRPIPIAALKGFWLVSPPAGATGLVAEVRLLSRSGEEIAFRDAGSSAHDDTRVPALYRALSERYPHLVLRERAAR